MNAGYVNYIPAKDAKARAVCEICGKKSRPAEVDSDGEPQLFALAAGWSTAPYPHDFTHDDGSRGALWTCPKCNRAFKAGATLRTRQYSPGVSA